MCCWSWPTFDEHMITISTRGPAESEHLTRRWLQWAVEALSDRRSPGEGGGSEPAAERAGVS
jgi:hypothetical protein